MKTRFSRGSYELLSQALYHAKPSFDMGRKFGYGQLLEQWEKDCSSIADALVSTSAAFDKALFLRNCREGLNPS